MRYASRMNNVHKSFVREILKVTEKDDVISFAGGLPNSEFFPVNEVAIATQNVLKENGKNVLQYSTTEGYLPLREYICRRYYGDMPDIKPENIIITNGSQQALDLIGKVLLNAGDGVIIEKPGYLGAIQAFSVFEPSFESVHLGEDGLELEELVAKIEDMDAKIIYTVPNFQNPTGITYTLENRKKLGEIVNNNNIILIEDNPYGELRFKGVDLPMIKKFAKDKVISLGSFSKVFAPAMRLGWLCASKELIEKLVIVKQASDLHTNYFSQRVLYQYLLENDLDEHISEIRKSYSDKKEYMIKMIKRYMPREINYTQPEGGMFLWIELPEKFSSMELFDRCSKRNVAFVPGNPFYVNTDDVNTLRLNYTCSSIQEIEEGIIVISEEIKKMLNQ